MAWFKFGKRNDDARGASPRSAKARTQQASNDSVEAMRQKAKFRLIGSIVLVLAAVVGFPMLFDSQPRTVPVDIPIDIPDKAKVAPLPPVRSPTNAPSAPAPAATVENKASLSNKEEIVSSGQTADKPNASTSVPRAAAAAVGAAAVAAGTAATQSGNDDAAVKAAAKAKQAEADKARKAAEEEKAKAAKVKAAEAEKAKRALEASRAKALLDDQTAQAQPAEAKPAASAEAGRFVVQFGAFTDVAKSREVRQKVEKAGLKTYSQVAKTADGEERIRVRVGPFASRAEAEKAAAKIKALDLPASILTL
jgi:DedD protein